MKRKYIAYMASVAVFVLVSCNPEQKVDNGGETPGPEQPVLPEPPETVVKENVFIVDYFSTLSDNESFFSVRDCSVAAEHIKTQSGKRPVLYMFDRADFETGKANPAVKIAYQAGAQPFFAQSGKSADGVIEGTGIVSNYMISDFDGACIGGESFISGCTLPVPLNKVTPVCVFTASIDDVAVAGELMGAIEYRIKYDGVIIGTVDNGIKNNLKTYVSEHFPAVRLEFYGNDDTDKDLFVIVPGSFVCRGMESLNKVNLPYWRISIEKLS